MACRPPWAVFAIRQLCPLVPLAERAIKDQRCLDVGHVQAVEVLPAVAVAVGPSLGQVQPLEAFFDGPSADALATGSEHLSLAPTVPAKPKGNPAHQHGRESSGTAVLDELARRPLEYRSSADRVVKLAGVFTQQQ